MASLLKKALKDFAIDEDSKWSDSDEEPELVTQLKPKSGTNGLTTTNTTNKYGFRKRKKKEELKMQRKRDLSRKQTQLKSNSEALLLKHRKRDYLHDNLEGFKQLSSVPQSLTKQTDLALKQHLKRVDKTSGVKPKHNWDPPRGSLFSEKDFKEFEGELQDLFTK